MALPRFVVLKSNQNNKYLRYLHEEKNGVPAGFLSFCGEEPWSHYSTFELERSKTSNNEDLVHFRCCYNNKYLSIMNQWIVAGAHEPVEDQSILSCTLFEAVFLDDHRPADDAYGLSYTLRFRHAQLGNFMLLLENKTVARFGGLSLGSAWPDVNLLDYVCTLTDRESILTLPKHLAFRCFNGNYLCARRIRGSSYLQFKSDDVENILAQEMVQQEVFTNADGTLRLKSSLFGKFWRLVPGTDDFILADDTSDVSLASKHTLFWPIKVGESRIVLRNMHNDRFCKWYETEVEGALSGNDYNVSDRSTLEVHELVDLRKLYNVKFRLGDSRIYNRKTVEMAREVAVNLTEESQTVEVTLSHTKMRKSSWSWSTTWMLKPGVKSSIHAEVPVIADHGKVEIDMTAGEVVHEAATVTVTGSDVMTTAEYKIVVPAETTVKVRLLATEAWCDVPFSYTQDDTLANGKIITYDKDDGVYSGVNAFDFKFHTTEEML